MEIKATWLAIPFLCFAPWYASAEQDTNNAYYRFLYADLSAGSLNENLGTNSNVTALDVGGNWLPTDNVIVSFDYSARFIHPDITTTEIYTLLPGVGYRYGIANNFDVYAIAKAGFVWAKQTNDITDEKLESDDEFMLGGELGVKYALSSALQLGASVELNRSDLIDEDVYTLDANYLVSTRFLLGGFYRHREGDGTNSTNEGGVSIKFLY
ncbi:porin family protein [Vibrio sinensis]|uniref:Porin family protein n=1 Tax=Vibrio sinensis TaxID=2302434 RepID=A0A3A6QBC4_9VIBR|nr:outer membrane beta-barrel protein [Vibrio sinensis]RJX69554.1 porin family protein [Vibrio sinensis]